MDIALARTFLMVAETGSFIDAARKMNITQSTVSARIKGARRHVRAHAVRSIQERRRAHGSRRAVPEARAGAGARVAARAARGGAGSGSTATIWPSARWRRCGTASCCRWISWLRGNVPDIAISASASLPAVMIQRLLEGTLDLAIMYEPGQPPGFDHRAPVRRGIRAGDQRARAQPAPSERLRVRRLGARLPGRARGGLPRAQQHRRQSGPGLAWASTTCSPTRRPAISRAASSRTTSTAGACASRPGRARSPARLHGLSRGARRGGLRADPARPAAGFEAAAVTTVWPEVGSSGSETQHAV